MRIVLYDRGSPQGKKMFQQIEEICRRLQVYYDPEYSHDMERVYRQGIQGKTVLTIDNQVVLVDRYPGRSELEAIISDYL